MYYMAEGSQRMTANEASELYPDSFILMRMDSMDISDRMGSVLYIGDTQRELFALVMQLEDPSLCGIIEGINHQYSSLGGVVIGG